MAHKVTLSRKAPNRNHLLRNLATSVLLYEQIDTTKAKAHAVKRIIDRWISRSQAGTVQAKRILLAQVLDHAAADKMFDILIKRYQNRSSGFTRVTQIGPRRGDGAMVVRVELIDRDEIPPDIVEKSDVKTLQAPLKSRSTSKKPKLKSTK